MYNQDEISYTELKRLIKLILEDTENYQWCKDSLWLYKIVKLHFDKN